jgi:GrpB-like predicted nucleotidyltransferase (UPF0157 family)
MSAPLPGLPPGAVYLAEYCEEWPSLFEVEAARLSNALGRRAIAIEHYGSTSISGLAAKPVIDLLVGVATLDHALVLIPQMEQLGYDFAPDAGVPGHHIFGLGTHRTHLAHFVQFDGDQWRACLAFRDRLRASQSLTRAYEALKQGLAKEFPTDRAAYTAAKTDFILGILQGNAWD